jgi:hypothetical protein
MNDISITCETIFDLFISVLLGIILGVVIYKFYLFPPLIKGPNSCDIVDKIFEYDGKYYELEPIVCGCLK